MRKYGVAATFDFPVYNPDGVDLDTDWVPANADCELIKDGGASTAITATAVDEGVTYSIALNATEMQCARGVIKVQDAATKVILDIVMTFDTYGDVSAQHAFDLDSTAPISDVHSRLVVIETAADSDQAQTEASIDSDQVQNDNFVSDIHSRLVVMETAMDSDQAQTEASIDSDQLLDITAVSNVHSRLVVMEAAMDSDQAQTEASIDSDQVINDTIAAAITSNLVIIASDTLAIEASSPVLFQGTADSGSTTTLVDAALTEGDTDYWVGNMVEFTNGNIDGQVREITGFNFTTNTITFSPVTTQAVLTHTYNILAGVAASGMTAAQASDLALTEVQNSNIHSRLVVMETAADSDQAQTEASIDSDQVQNDNFVSDIHSRLVVIEAAIDSDQAQTEASIDSDQLVDATATSNIHSRLVVMEAAMDSDQAQTEASIDSDQVINDTIATAITSNLVIIASDTVVIESQTTVMENGLVTGACEGTPTTTVIQTNLAEITDDHYIGRIVVFTSGNALGEASDITDYAGATGTLTVTVMTTAPANTDTFTIY